MTHPLLASLGQDASVFIHQYHVLNARALLVRLGAAQLRAASFLDDRVIAPGVETAWVPLADADMAAARAPAFQGGVIFHIGHCGSTLISRLIEEAAGVRSLREPAVFRTLAQLLAADDDGVSLWPRSEIERRLQLALNVAGRGKPAIIKVTSFCGDLAPYVSGPVLFCKVRPEAYIASMMNGANPIDLKLHAGLRLKRLRRLAGDFIAPLSEFSPGEMAAMSWASECAAALAPMKARGALFMSFDFDRFLEDPSGGLARICSHFGMGADPAKIAATLSGPLMNSYAKDFSYAYSPKDRREILAENLAAHQAEVGRGRDWLMKAAGRHRPVKEALDQFGE